MKNKLQKLFLAGWVFLLPFSGRAQIGWPEIRYDQSCTAEDRKFLENLESRLKLYDSFVLGDPRLREIVVICIDSPAITGWSDFEGNIGIPSLSQVGSDWVAHVYAHERGHAFEPTPFKWSLMEAAAELIAKQYATLLSLKVPALPNFKYPTLREALTENGSSGQFFRYQSGLPLNYHTAALSLAILASADETGTPADQWAHNDAVKKIYRQVRKNRRESVNLAWTRLETIKTIAKAFSHPVSGFSAEIFLRQEGVHSLPQPGKHTGFLTVNTDGTITARNPEWGRLISFRVKDRMDSLWMLNTADAIPRYLENREAFIRIVGRKVVWESRVTTQYWRYFLRGLPEGAYSVEVWSSEDKGVLLHRNQFAAGVTEEGVLILKTDWAGEIGSFPITIGNARILQEGPGFSVVEPNCKDVRPCEITVQSDMLETFTILTPWWKEQVVRLHNRRPVFDLPETVILNRIGKIEIKSLVPIPGYEWSFTALTPGVNLDRWTGQGDSQIAVYPDSAMQASDSAILRFDCPTSADTPQYIEVKIIEFPSRARR